MDEIEVLIDKTRTTRKKPYRMSRGGTVSREHQRRHRRLRRGVVRSRWLIYLGTVAVLGAAEGMGQLHERGPRTVSNQQRRTRRQRRDHMLSRNSGDCGDMSPLPAAKICGQPFRWVGARIIAVGARGMRIWRSRSVGGIRPRTSGGGDKGYASTWLGRSSTKPQ